MTDIRVPTLGESVTEATIGKWFKKPGDPVAVDEPLVELETDKVTIEVPAPAAGVLGEIAAKDGETVAVGALLGQIEDGAGTAAAKPPQPAAARRPRAAGREAKRQPPPRQAPTSPPSVRKLVAESGVDAVDGARLRQGRPRHQGRHDGGDRARRRGADARAAARGFRAGARAVAGRRCRARGAREDDAAAATIARRLKDAQNTAAMLTTFNEVDMSAVMAMRADYKELFEKKHGVKLGFMGFFVKACVQALEGDPRRQRRDRRHRPRLQELLPRRHRGRHRAGPGGAGGARLRPEIARPDREGDRRSRPPRARRRAQDRGDAGRHLHHHQRRRLRLADVDADPQRAAVRHPRHAQDPGAADGASPARSSRGR